MNQSMYSPVLLQGLISSISPGEKKEFPEDSFENPFKSPMLVDEIRFSLNTTGSNVTNLLIQVELFVGRTPLTNGPVPIRCLGRALNMEDTSGFNYLPLTWRLPKPLFLDTHETLIARVTYVPGYLVVARSITMIVAGRSLPSGTKRPKVIHMPWVASFMTPYASSVDQTDVSTEVNLMNPFGETLHVQRFIGRYDTMANTGGSPDNGLYTEKYAFVRAVDSFGNILVRDPTPFMHLFQAPTRSWTVNAQLAPKGFYLFTIDRQWATGHYSGGLAMSMVGYHDVQQR